MTEENQAYTDGTSNTTETPKKTRKKSLENQALAVAKAFRKTREKYGAEEQRHSDRLVELSVEKQANLAARDALSPEARTVFDRLNPEDAATAEEATEEQP